MYLRIVYDNEAKAGFRADWGFACLIETAAGTLLFDTGASPDLLSHNLGRFGVSSDQIGLIGGFHGFAQLELLRALDVIAPCHCTAQKRAIHAQYPAQTVQCGAGTVIELP